VILLKIYVAQHTKRQVRKMHVSKMFITAVRVIFLIKLRWPKTKSLYDNATVFQLVEDETKPNVIQKFYTEIKLERPITQCQALTVLFRVANLAC